MKVLRDRIYRLVVGDPNTGTGFEVTQLNISYDVSRSADNKKGGNSGSVEIYNLTAEHRSRLDRPNLTVQLYTGYVDTGLKLLLEGEVTESGTRRDGPNLVTQLIVGEGYVSLNHKKVKATIAPNTTVEKAFDALLKEMPGISRGSWVGTNLSSPLIRGYSLSGPVKDQMNRLAHAYGLEYSIANNVLNITDRNQGTNQKGEAPLLNPASGVVGLPFRVAVESGKSPKDKTRQFGIQVRILCDAAIYPGMIVKLEVGQYNGWYRVSDARYFGEFRGNAWYCDMIVRDLEEKSAPKPALDTTKALDTTTAPAAA